MRDKQVTRRAASLWAKEPKSITVGNAVLSVPKKNGPSGTTVPTESLPCVNKAKLPTAGNGIDRSVQPSPQGEVYIGHTGPPLQPFC